MPTLQEQFGKRVREIRKGKGFTQEGFALHAGLERANYGSVERGRENVCLVNIAKIAKGLGVKPRELFDFGKKRKR